MSIDDFEDMMSDTVTVTSKTGSDGYGKPTYSADVKTYKARVTYVQKLVRDLMGQEKVSDGNVLISGTPVIQTDDQVELSDGATPVILATERHFDEDGAHHTRVFFSTARGPK